MFREAGYIEAFEHACQLLQPFDAITDMFERLGDKEAAKRSYRQLWKLKLSALRYGEPAIEDIQRMIGEFLANADAS